MTMPWELPPIKAREEIWFSGYSAKVQYFVGDGLDIPPALKRDANNRAPFMDFPSPSASLPASAQTAVPPWASTFPPRDA